MKTKNLYVGKNIHDNYTLIVVDSSGIIYDMKTDTVYENDYEYFKPINENRNTIPLLWYTRKEDIDKEEAFKLYEDIVLKLKTKK